MNVDTQTALLHGSPSEVFDFLADPENLPRWAVGFCRSIRRDGERWMVRTGHGEIPIRLDASARAGTIDFWMEVEPGVEVGAFSRVIPAPGGAAYVFTQLQAPGMPDAAFEAQVSALREELRVLQSIARARAACPA